MNRLTISRALINALLLLLCMLLLTACGHHQPAPVEEHSSAKSKAQLNPDGSYRVRKGDTLYAIAFSNGKDHRDVAKWNNIARPYVIYPGQNLRMSPPPASSKSSAVQISKVATPAASTTKTLTTSKAVESSAAKKPPANKSVTTSSKPKPVPPTAKKPPPAPVSSTKTADPTHWKWPTSGRVIRGYVAANPARNGLDIAGKEGQPVIATAAGKVVYSGNGLIGYGELIIIKHSERMLSAYAHNKLRLVKEGQQVSAGQKIAEMGRNAQNEQLLHFEIRTRGKPVNPLIYLPKK